MGTQRLISPISVLFLAREYWHFFFFEKQCPYMLTSLSIANPVRSYKKEAYATMARQMLFEIRVFRSYSRFFNNRKGNMYVFTKTSDWTAEAIIPKSIIPGICLAWRTNHCPHHKAAMVLVKCTRNLLHSKDTKYHISISKVKERISFRFHKKTRSMPVPPRWLDIIILMIIILFFSIFFLIATWAQHRKTS